MLMVCGEGNGNPLQCSCLENPRNGGAWWVAVYGVAQSWTQLKRLSSSSSSNGVWRYIPYELVFSFWFLIGCCILFHTFPVYFTISPYFTTFQGGKYGMEKAMAPHSRTLAWKISWMEEPGRLHSMGSLRGGHDWATSLSLFTLMHWRRKWQPTPVFLPGESQGRGSLVGCRLWGRTESDTTGATQLSKYGKFPGLEVGVP